MRSLARGRTDSERSAKSGGHQQWRFRANCRKRGERCRELRRRSCGCSDK